MKNIKKTLALAALLVLVLTAAAPALASGTDMPDWFPSDTSTWIWTPADPDAPRVIDEADLLDPEEEKAVSEAVRAAAEATGTDIVIFTDTTTHGMDISVYAADFYDFNGYGTNYGHDGFCLCLIVNGRDREGWCCVTGAPRVFYTEENAELIDDELYGFLGSDRYAEGIIGWTKNITNLVKKGYPFTPDWWPDVGTPSSPKDPNAPRVTDETGRISGERIAAIAEKAKKISDKYGVDVAVHFADEYEGLDPQFYSDVFYNRSGYGSETDDNGILLTVFSSGSSVMTMGEGVARKLSGRNISRLLKGANMLFDSETRSANRWLKYLDRTLKTGRTPKTPVVWTIAAAVCAVIAWIVSGTGSAKDLDSMKTVLTAFTAGDHLINDTLSVSNVGDLFIRSEQNRSYSPPVSSSGGRSGSHSSHSGSYSGHSGTSHSGSGRKF